MIAIIIDNITYPVDEYYIFCMFSLFINPTHVNFAECAKFIQLYPNLSNALYLL